jgi:hypothetical protein
MNPINPLNRTTPAHTSRISSVSGYHKEEEKYFTSYDLGFIIYVVVDGIRGI